MGAYQLVFVEPQRSSDDATVTASTYTGEHVAANIQHENLGKVWRTTGDTSENMVWDFGEAQTINCLVIGPRHNLTIAATVEVRASTDNFAASDVEILAERTAVESFYGYGEGGYGAEGYGGYLLDDNASLYDPVLFYDWADVSYQYWKVTIKDPDNTDTYIEIPRMALESKTIFSRGYQWPRFKDVDRSPRGRTSKGTPWASSRRLIQRVTIPFREVSEGDWFYNIRPFVRRNQTIHDFYLILDVNDEENHGQFKRVYGRMADTPEFQTSYGNNGTFDMVIEESI